MECLLGNSILFLNSCLFLNSNLHGDVWQPNFFKNFEFDFFMGIYKKVCKKIEECLIIE